VSRRDHLSGKRESTTGHHLITVMDDLRHAAATKIQARARGMIDRKRVREKRRRCGGRRRASSAKAQGQRVCSDCICLRASSRHAQRPAQRPARHCNRTDARCAGVRKRKREANKLALHRRGHHKIFQCELTRAEEEIDAPRWRTPCSHAPRGANFALSHAHSLTLTNIRAAAPAQAVLPSSRHAGSAKGSLGTSKERALLRGIKDSSASLVIPGSAPAGGGTVFEPLGGGRPPPADGTGGQEKALEEQAALRDELRAVVASKAELQRQLV